MINTLLIDTFTVSLPVAILLLVSAIVGIGIAAGAAFLYRMNGPVLNATSIMLSLTSIEILFAMAADLVLHNSTIFATIKIVGRVIEGSGVLYFLFVVTRKIGKNI